MAVDLSNARKGDTVKFRCGGEVEIDSVERKDARWHIAFGNRYQWSYNADGTDDLNPTYEPLEGGPFDIVELIKAPFDWSAARPGMAFYPHAEAKPADIIFYVGRACILDGALMQTRSGAALFVPAAQFEYGVRAEEHDIEVRP